MALYKATAEHCPPRAYEASVKSIESILQDPTSNYIRSSALYQQRLAAIELGQGMEGESLFNRRNFVLAVQPFLKPETRAVHRDWEQWILHGAITGQLKN